LSRNTSTKVGRSSPAVNYEIRVQIGDICCSFICPDKELFSSFKHIYDSFLTDKPADTTIELEEANRLNASEAETALAEARFIHEEGHFRATNLIIAGEHDAAGRITRVKLEKSLLNPDLEFNQLNRMISLAYYTACKVRYNGNPPAFLVHSCGILRQGQVMLFAGPCETGKTTIARLCGNQYGQVVNDEMLLISRSGQNNGALRVQGVPIIGGVTQRLNVAAPLNCVLFLKQSNRTTARRLNRLEAYLRFMRQIIAPAYIGQRGRRAIHSLMAEFADEVTKITPAYELEFTLDKETLWEVVTELEISLRKESGNNGKPHSQG